MLYVNAANSSVFRRYHYQYAITTCMPTCNKYLEFVGQSSTGRICVAFTS